MNNEIEQATERRISAIEKKAKRLQTELVETYRCITELTNELESANEALQESENFLQTVMDAIPEFTMVVDLNYRILMANRAVRELAGKDPVSGGMKCHQVTHHSDRPCEGLGDPCPLQQVVATKAQATVIHTHYDKEGSERFIEVKAAPIFDDTGEVIQIIETGRDITELIRSTKALRESDERSSIILKTVPVGILVIDPETHTIVDANPVAVKSIGTHKNQIIGKLCHEYICPTEKGRCSINDPTQKADNMESTLLTVDGRKIPVLKSAATVLLDGRNHLLECFVNITERKQVEEQIHKSRAMLQAVFDGISDPLMMLDGNLTIKMLNMAACEHYQVDQPQDVIGKPCYRSFDGKSSPCEGCKIPAAITSDQRVTFERKGLINPDRIDQVVVFPLPKEQEKMIGAIVHVRDITEKKKIEDQLVRADRLSSLGQLSGGIAHEIRNPLAGISLFTDILCDKDRFDQTQKELEILDEVKANVNKIDAIIKRVLDFAKPSTTSVDEVDINSLVRENIKLWAAKIRKSEIKLALFLEEDLPSIRGDAVELQQVTNNLFLNAIEAMDAGGSLDITTHKEISSFYQDREVVTITVKDSGPGIEQQHAQSIFNPFFTTKATGTGLGLAISHQIIERHGGVISFESKPDQGTTFTVELPAIAED